MVIVHGKVNTENVKKVAIQILRELQQKKGAA